MTETRTRETVALEWLQRFGTMAAHEFNAKEFTGYSENTICTGLSNLQAQGKVIGTTVPGKRYKSWAIVNPGQLELGVE